MIDTELMEEEQISQRKPHGVVEFWSKNQDTVGAILLAILAVLLLFALLRAQKKIRDLLEERRAQPHDE
jgi:hypothetical protein